MGEHDMELLFRRFWEVSTSQSIQRLRSLPYKAQEHIAEKYYYGTFIWREEFEERYGKHK